MREERGERGEEKIEGGSKKKILAIKRTFASMNHCMYIRGIMFCIT